MRKNPELYDEDDRKAIFKMEMNDYERFYSVKAMATEDYEYFIEKVHDPEKHTRYDGVKRTNCQNMTDLFSTIISGMWACGRILTKRKDGTL